MAVHCRQVYRRKGKRGDGMKDGVISRRIPRINIFVARQAISSGAVEIFDSASATVPVVDPCRPKQEAAEGIQVDPDTPLCAGHRPTITDFSTENSANRNRGSSDSRAWSTDRKCDAVQSLSLSLSAAGELGTRRSPGSGTFRFLTPFSLLTRPLARNGYRDRWLRCTRGGSLTVQLLSRPRNPGVRVSFSNGLLFRLSTKDPPKKREVLWKWNIYMYMCIVDRIETIAIFRHPLHLLSLLLSRMYSCTWSRNPINSKQFAILGPIRPREQPPSFSMSIDGLPAN